MRGCAACYAMLATSRGLTLGTYRCSAPTAVFDAINRPPLGVIRKLRPGAIERIPQMQSGGLQRSPIGSTAARGSKCMHPDRAQQLSGALPPTQILSSEPT